MTDPAPHPGSDDDIGEDTRVAPDLGSNAGTPRWVKMFGIIALVLVLLFVIVHLTGGGLADHFAS